MITEKPKQMPLCKCECGKRIVWNEGHRYKDIPRFISGHNRVRPPIERPKQMPLCECKCGKRIVWISRYRYNGISKFIKGHNQRKRQQTEKPKQMSLCGCGCNERLVWNEGHRSKGISKFIEGHHMRGKTLSEKTKKKMSEASKGNKYSLGKTHSKKTRKKMSATKQGIELKEWNGFTSCEPYDQKWTTEFKRAIRKRDNQVCMLCGIHREKLKEALHVHHIDYYKENTCKENCISLCLSCHGKTNTNREEWKLLFQSLLSKRYGYEYLRIV